MLNIVLLIIGIIALEASFIPTHSTNSVKINFNKTKRFVLVNKILILLFLLGYLYLLYYLISNINDQNPNIFFVSLIFFLGSLFVLHSSVKLNKLIIQCKENNDALVLSNDKTLKYKQKLEKTVKDQSKTLRKNEKKLAKNHQAILKILDDVTSEKEKLSLLLKSIGDGVIGLNHQSQITLCNPTSEKLLNISVKIPTKKKYYNYFKIENEHGYVIHNDLVSKVFKKSIIISLPPHSFLKTKKVKIPISGSIAPIIDINNQVKGCILVFHDNSEELSLEKAKDKFVSMASHQLRTPLTSIKWILEILLKQNSKKYDKDQLKFLNQINESNDRLIFLVNDLLDVSLMDDNEKFILNKKATNINKIIKDVLLDNIERINTNKVKIKNKVTHKIDILVDDNKIRQVFQNIINNAIKYTKGEVKISAFINKNRVEFRIKDDGIGIPEKQQKQMFQKFFRADNAIQQKITGTGLGLYIVKAIVEAHNGEIRFKSIENKGTEFVISLPYKKINKK